MNRTDEISRNIKIIGASASPAVFLSSLIRIFLISIWVQNNFYKPATTFNIYKPAKTTNRPRPSPIWIKPALSQKWKRQEKKKKKKPEDV